MAHALLCDAGGGTIAAGQQSDHLIMVAVAANLTTYT